MRFIHFFKRAILCQNLLNPQIFIFYNSTNNSQSRSIWTGMQINKFCAMKNISR